SVQFGPGTPGVEGVRISVGNGSSSWRSTGSLAAGTGPGAQVVLTATAEAIRTENHGTDAEPDEVEIPFTATRQVTVVTEHSFPSVGFDPYPHDVTPATPPYQLALTGTATDVQSGIVSVQARVDNNTPVAARNVSGDWSHWAADLPVPVGDHTIRADATDGLGNVGSWSDTITVKANIEPTPLEQAFAVTSYLKELLGTASRYLRLDGASTGPSTVDLAGRLHQPLDRVVQPANFTPATVDVAQARVGVEVLRGTLVPPAPAALDQKYRAQAYEAILRELGTSSEELRLARTGDSRTRRDLAARLGIGLEATRPDRLDVLTISPDAITDAQLEQLLGYRSTTPFDPLATPAPAAVPQWQQDALQSVWQQADEVQRDQIDAPYPVIDPDVISEGHIRNHGAADPAHTLWAQRHTFIAAQVTDVSQRFSGSARTAAGFDPALSGAGLTIDLAAFAARDRAGDDISIEVSALGLTLEAFRFLARIRELLAAGTVTESEWQDVISIVVQVRKRRAFGTWRHEEKQSGVVLQPSAFVAESADDPVAFTGPLRWRADWSTLAEWRRTLIARRRQSDAADAGYRAVVDAAEKEVLPALRDALLAEVGARSAPPQSAEQAAERLSRELSLDFRAAPGTRTTRVGQAVDSLQSLLVAARSGALPAAAGGHSATISDEVSFDLEWAWLETYTRWRAAMQAFAYPESRLLPGLFLPESAGADRVLAPTAAFLTFLFGADQISGLVNRSRLTPDEAIALARDYLATVKAELGVALTGVELTNRRPDSALDAYRDLCTQLTAGPTQEQQIPQHLREVFWLVPVALGRK
ncbi:MAG TPA: neuraminidase-like domain-containing protein, partial [Micromonosporaceae bacterium]|nr:neuraminidase-like domain-containing protein [Micromonosporaceae bacterium]